LDVLRQRRLCDMQLFCCVCHVQRVSQNSEVTEMPIFNHGESMTCFHNHNLFIEFRSQILASLVARAQITRGS